MEHTHILLCLVRISTLIISVLNVPTMEIDQVSAGTVKESDIDAVVMTMLRTKFALGLFESKYHSFPSTSANSMTLLDPYPYADYNRTLRTQATREILHQMEREAIVLLENRDQTLPLSPSDTSKVAIIGPQSNRVSVCHPFHFAQTF